MKVTGPELAGFFVMGWVPFVQTVMGWPPWPMTVIEFGLVVRTWTEVLTSADEMTVRTPLAVGVAAWAAGAMAAPAVPMMTVAAAMTPAIFIRFITTGWHGVGGSKHHQSVTYLTPQGSASSGPQSGWDERSDLDFSQIRSSRPRTRSC